jgi:glycosyltransferase involved in cell wall biosynthesis
MMRADRGRDTDRAIDAAVAAEFTDRYGDPKLGPVCIVIAAYQEAGALGAVLDQLPTTALGLVATTLVVDDGSHDGTADVADRHHAFAARPALNRGQGAALRLGYALAALHGAEYIVTTDADGQYDPNDIEAVLAPVVEGRADFVSGSRRLGSSYRGDGFRQLGVVVYAGLIRLLTHQPVTDPSFGLRAMRVEVPSSVELRQPQFQASELLVGAVMRGFRVAEVPARMRRRAVGDSRKGNDVLYGAHFGWVVLSTWWRERTSRTRR